MKQPNLSSFLSAILIAFLLIVVPSEVFAGHERSYKSKTGTAIPLSALDVKDPKYTQLTSGFLWQNIYDHRSATGYISFSVNKNSKYFSNTDQVPSVPISYVYYDENGVRFPAVGLPAYTATLEASYESDPGSGRLDRSTLRVPNAHRLIVEVGIISPGGVDLTPFKLEVEVDIDRYYKVAQSWIPSTSYVLNSSQGQNTENGILELNWQTVKGAEEYDLEYTYVNNYPLAPPYNVSQAANAIAWSNADFDKNSTRVRLSENNYELPLVYDKGFVLWRVRGVGRQFPPDPAYWDREVRGAWSSQNAVCGNVSCFDHFEVDLAHEALLNWQHIASFAEEGKRKDVVSYMDGSMRNRQTVTKLNSEDRSIFVETHYDHAGRAALQTLPAPMLDDDKGLGYVPQFSLGNATTPYNVDNIESGTGSGCSTSADPMNNTAGVSNYYSPNNPSVDKHNAFIPDAAGYSFAQTVYTPDNTGRVRSQGGVGSQLGIDGEHTLNYYDQPPQVNLDRLFGHDVGWAKHYKRQVTLDPNGQASVTYVDAHGRTIATALAGEVPADMEPVLHDVNGTLVPLPTDVSVQLALTEDLLNKASVGANDTQQDNNDVVNSPSKIGLEFSAARTIVAQGGIDLDYSITPSAYTPNCGSLVYPVVYTATLDAKNECGVSELGGQQSLNLNTSIGAVASYTGTTQNLGTYSWTNAAPSSYQIDKFLEMDQDALDNYVLDYIADQSALGGCLVPLDDFIAAAAAALPDSSDCIIGCDDCDVDPFDPLDPDDVAAQAECDEACEAPSLCESFYQAMLMDVSPGGQYAVTSSSDPKWSISLLNPNNVFFGTPTPPSFQDPSSPYLDGAGNSFLIQVTPLSGGGFDPAVRAGVTVVNNEVSPDQLENASDFVSFWEPQFAEALVGDHPEYMYYDDFCVGIAYAQHEMSPSTSNCSNANPVYYSSEQFDEATRAAAFAPGSGICVPIYDASGILQATVDVTDPEEFDPFVTAGLPVLSDMGNELMFGINGRFHDYSDGMSMIEVARHMDINPNFFAQPLPTLPVITTAGQLFDNAAQWENFRQIYLAAKRDIQERVANNQAVDGNYHCGCIGNPQYGADDILQCLVGTSWPSGLPGLNGLYTTLTTLPQFTCNVDRMDLLENCDRRFMVERPKPVCDDPLYFETLTAEAEAGFCSNTGQCPDAVRLEQLLTELGAAGSITNASTALTGVQSFGLDIYEQVDPTISNITYNWVTSNSGTDLDIDFQDANDLSNDCHIDLNIEATPGIAWSGLGSTWAIDHFSDLLPTDPNSASQVLFSATMWVDLDLSDPANALTPILVTGNSGCIEIAGCTPATSVFQPSPINFDLVAVINQLNDAPAPNNSLSTNGTLSTPEFDWFIADNGSGPWTWTWNSTGGVNANGLFSLSNADGTYEMEFVDPVPVHAGLTFPDDFLLERFSAPETGTCQTANANAMGYWVFNSALPNDPVVLSCDEVCMRVEYVPTVGTTVSAIGAIAAPDVCTSPQAQNAVDMLDFLNGAINDGRWGSMATNSPTLIDLSTYSWYNTGIGGTLGSAQCGQWLTSNYTGLSLTADLSYGSSTCHPDNPLSQPCPFVIEFANPATVPSGSTLANISSFTSVAQVPNNLLGSYANPAIYFATISGVDYPVVVSSCIEVAPCQACELCDQVAGPVSCYDAYTLIDVLVGISTIGYSDEETFCQDIQGPCANDYVAFYDQLGVTTGLTNSHALYMDFNTFCSGNYRWLYPNFVEYINVVTSNTPSAYTTSHAHFMHLYDFAMLAPGSECLTSFEAHLLGGGTTTIDQWCGGYPQLDLCAPLPDPLPLIELPDPCLTYLANMATANGTAAYNSYIASIAAQFRSGYIAEALAGPVETLDLSYNDQEYHYTLYYYDQSGDLVRTVPPEGVERKDDQTHLSNAMNDHLNGTSVAQMSHTLHTSYVYNSLHQLVESKVPDHTGSTSFYYDDLGRIYASQDAWQAPGRYSYTSYDDLGRITESGEVQINSVPNSNILNDPALLNSNSLYASRNDVAKTYYSEDQTANFGIASLDQENLRNRVAHTTFIATHDANVPFIYDHASHYSYDIHGNVKHLVQDFNDSEMEAMGQRFKHMLYQYDLISGNVLQVDYQDEQADALHHRYDYDADNRILRTETSRDGVHWERDAKYSYYTHGPLARTEVGERRVQGTDHAYTLQGWLKVVNADTDDYTRDIGQDGIEGGSASAATKKRKYVARDVFGYSLGYFDNDYTEISARPQISQPIASVSASLLENTNLYNGNIRSMVTSNHAVKAQLSAPAELGFAFRYDQLNRLRSSEHIEHSSGSVNVTGNNAWSGLSGDEHWNVDMRYDQNGNIDQLNRKGNDNANLQMDELAYTYAAGTNQLTLLDESEAANAYGDDLHSQVGITNEFAYTYDAVGRLITDGSFGHTFEWNAQQKIRNVRASVSGDKTLDFLYDAGGNRIAKIIQPVNSNEDQWSYTYHVRDAQGNVMATYRRAYRNSDQATTAEEYVQLEEQPIYGSSRVGVWTQESDRDLATRTVSYSGFSGSAFFTPSYSALAIDPGYAGLSLFEHKVGLKHYELSDHLGNVRTTITDDRVAVAHTNGSGDVGRHLPVSITAKSFYPFGMVMPGRHWIDQAGLEYRYGFQNQETDEELYGANNAVNYKYRMHDPRVGRFFSVDPLAPWYAWNSPYAFSENRVIDRIELEGLEIAIPMPRVIPRLTIPQVVPLPPAIPLIPTAPTPGVPISPPAPSFPSIPRLEATDIDWGNAVPANPGELPSEWEETTSTKNKSGGTNREFTNNESGRKIEFDKGNPNKPGFRGKDHWHRLNPNWGKSMGKLNKYLDKAGNPVKDGSNPSHILPDLPNGSVLPVINVWPNSDKDWIDYDFKMKNYKQEFKEWKEEWLPTIIKEMEQKSDLLDPRNRQKT